MSGFNLQTLAAEFLLLPAFVVFLLLIAPVGLLQRIGGAIVRLIGTPVTRYNINFIMFVGCVASVFFFIELRAHYQKYVSTPRPSFDNPAMSWDWKGKKWRLERDLYLSGLTCILYFALHTIATLRRKLNL